ncbi:type II secretion/transformation system, E protein [Arcobacter venerupis]|uniref:Type II secretion/transformation system, E protein n=1 Tax=Arcobacter venerupis TaxID=1054033 RepID=A0AAE7BCZ5_9BACT|nr:GspE/PulE family protein [Arcobacter venerupis]QKF68000.1 type II secretion/transformation system, E protein [Arcobacter venerupis]RWS48287.1 general secretion pathway protein GspE [Arcobacter venerupis]
MNINEIHNLNLVPFDEANNYTTALKNYVLYTKIDELVVIALSRDYMSISFDYLSKLDSKEDIVFLDDISFEKLYNKFLEIKTDKEMSAIQQEQEDATLSDDDFSVSEFLKVGSDILTSEESAPIIKFVNSLFYQAIKKKSSDIHIEMHEFKAEVRYRVDGVLTKHIELDKNIMSLVISRIKVVSNLDISEKRVPQDGRTQIKVAGKTLDIRVSILPTFYGERVVMRILMQSEDILSIKELGFPSYITDELESVLGNSYGMVLVTGPTGSGKSTTLHSLLHQVVSEEKNIITVEDPVEYKSNEFSQIQVNTKVGLTFAAGLRSILRQDPDIIMVGEIRDAETAAIAVQSALTGHLLFSTLHTNRAPAAITRLIDMGVEKFLISSSLLAVLAQRLVRSLCPDCKERDDSLASHKLFGFDSNKTIYKPVGCKSCNFTGYKGRVAIGELFIINDEIKEYLKTDVDDNTLMKMALKSGMISLDKQLKMMLENGDTSVSEVVRIGIK